VTPSQALVSLHHLLAEHGIATWGMSMTRHTGTMYPTSGTTISYSCGLFWWHTGRLRRGRPIYAIHPATDPAGAARRISQAAQVQVALSRRG
jgi:hypothetical protein